MLFIDLGESNAIKENMQRYDDANCVVDKRMGHCTRCTPYWVNRRPGNYEHEKKWSILVKALKV
jgi:hypothetical protein